MEQTLLDWTAVRNSTTMSIHLSVKSEGVVLDVEFIEHDSFAAMFRSLLLFGLVTVSDQPNAQRQAQQDSTGHEDNEASA
jgi:hypothetical protein